MRPGQPSQDENHFLVHVNDANNTVTHSANAPFIAFHHLASTAPPPLRHHSATASPPHFKLTLTHTLIFALALTLIVSGALREPEPP
jgi:hypothetical protein